MRTITKPILRPPTPAPVMGPEGKAAVEAMRSSIGNLDDGERVLVLAEFLDMIRDEAERDIKRRQKTIDFNQQLLKLINGK